MEVVKDGITFKVGPKEIPTSLETSKTPYFQVPDAHQSYFRDSLAILEQH